MRPTQVFLIGVASVALSSPLYAANLMQVYRQALKSDPIFAQAQSTWQSQKMNLPIAEAGYLPQLQIVANTDRDYARPSPANFGSLAGYTWQYGYGVTLTQPLFNGAVWASIKGAGANVKAATATFISAQQLLIQRTADAYFEVLRAYDNLRYTTANKHAVWEQFVTAREQFRVGLIAITDEYNARSRYDQVVAQEISAQNNLNIQMEALRAITGHNYRSLNGISRALPLLRPQPNNIDQWVDVANKQNYSIQAQNYTVIQAMHTIRQQAAARYPVLNLQGTYSDAHTAHNPYNNAGIPSTTGLDQGAMGLQLTYAPIQGGLVIANTKQARYNYVTQSGLLEQTQRSVMQQTRSSFLSVMSFISQVRADKQSIISAQKSLMATEAGMKVGTRTMVDVLDALRALYLAQQQFSADQYNYLDNLISLKAAAGTLSVGDLMQINSWLGKEIPFTQKVLTMTVAPDIDHVPPASHRRTTPTEKGLEGIQKTPLTPPVIAPISHRNKVDEKRTVVVDRKITHKVKTTAALVIPIPEKTAQKTVKLTTVKPASALPKPARTRPVPATNHLVQVLPVDNGLPKPDVA